MKQLTLRIIQQGKVESIPLHNGKTISKKATLGTKYQVVDETGQLVTQVKAETVGNDLLVFTEGAEQPSFIIQEYTSYYPIENAQYLANVEASFATAESAAATAEISTAMSATTGLTGTLSVANLATVALGGVAAAVTGVSIANHHKNKDHANEPEPTVPTITLDPITNDNLIDHIELQKEKITITGSVTNVNNGDTVTLKIGESITTGLVTDGRFAIEVDTKSLVVHQTITAMVANVSDSENYKIELPELTFDTVTADNIINIEESQKTEVTLNGSVAKAPENSTVKIVIGDQTFTATVDAQGKFSLPVSGDLLSKNTALKALVETPNGVVSQEVTHSYEVDLDAPRPTIDLKPITGDNKISGTEAKNEFTSIGGTVTGVEDGQEVTVSCGCATCSGVQWIDMKATVTNGEFKVDFKTVDLLKANYNIVKASVTAKDTAGNSTTVEDSETYTKPEPLQIDITKIDDFSFNMSDIDPLVRLKGTVEFAADDIYTQGLNAKRLHQINVQIGEKTYKAGFHDMQFFIDVPASELKALNGQNVSFNISVATGSWTNQDLHNNAYGLTKNNDGTYTTWMKYGAAVPQIKSVSLDSLHLEKLTETTYKVNYQADPTVEISGSITSSEDAVVKVGDKIIVKVGEQNYETTVLDGNVFSVLVDKSVLAKANKVTATLTTTDSTGAEVQVSDIENIISSRAVDGKHVITQVQPADSINNDHTSEGYNFPYFIEKLGGVRSAVNTVLGGKDTPLIYKYHIVTKEELADPNNIKSTRELKVKADSYLAPEEYHANFSADIRAAYKEIEKYINVKFVEVNSVAEADTNIYIATFESFATSAAYAWPGYSLIWNGGIKYDRSGNNFPFYTALHEIGHTLGMGHSGPTFKDVYLKEESLEFTNMSYNAYVDNGLYFNLKTLRMFDMAYLHHQFGVNKEARAGDDVYSFKAYNSYSADGDIYIWDGAGVDTFDASKEQEGVNVNLTPGSWIYVGDTREQNLVVKNTKTYTLQEYFNMPADTVIKEGAWRPLGKTTINEYTKGQAFIGFGTQIENLIGSDYNDNLTGNVADNNIYGGKGNDIINGGAGNDYLDGGAGADILVGGLGDDVFVLYDVADAVLELEGEGNDTIYSLANINLEKAEYVENVTLIGMTATEATGNDLNNILIANNIGNTLNGGKGDDRLVGGLGADTLIGGEGSDTFVFNTTLNGKIDTIDLQSGDKIEFSHEIFTALTPDNVNEFISLQEGKLYYDSDKSGPNEPVHFATTTGLINELSQVQFVVV